MIVYIGVIWFLLWVGDIDVGGALGCIELISDVEEVYTVGFLFFKYFVGDVGGVLGFRELIGNVEEVYVVGFLNFK